MLVHYSFTILLLFTANDVTTSQTPANEVEPSQTSANDVTTSQTPANDVTTSQTPTNDMTQSQTSANDVEPSQTSANDTEPSQTPANDLTPSQTPANDMTASQTSAAASSVDPTAGDAAVDGSCSYQNLLTHLDLQNDALLLSVVRPVRNHSTPTQVDLNVAVEAILDVVEKEQKLISRIFILMKWTNELISWDPSEFCGIRSVSVPSEWLWKPDVSIEERLEDAASLNPYIRIFYDGRILVRNTQMVTTTCRMNVYRFPFDTQSCNLTFSSALYRSDELELQTVYDATQTRLRSVSVLWGEYEWEFHNFMFLKVNQTTYKRQQIVYIITMKRKAVLYIVNFLLPVLFFLCLDMASFLISDTSGEKLGYKITVLLAVTVLQLILNDILPATSNRMPIIATYCIGTFFLMLLSLLETVVVLYLLEKDSQKTQTDRDRRLKKDKAKGCRCACKREKRSRGSLCFSNVSGDAGGDDDDGERERMHELHNVDEEESHVKVLDELRDLEMNLRLFLHNKEDVSRSAGYWSRTANRINTTFFLLYVSTVVLFLVFVFSEWHPEY